MRRRLAGSLTIGMLLAVACTAQAETVTYTTAGLSTLVVPAGVTTVRIDAVGGRGGAGADAPLGGFGARVSTTLLVTPGTPLYAYVGNNGANGAGGYPGLALLGGGGSGGTVGSPENGYLFGGGGAGGGPSDVRLTREPGPGYAGSLDPASLASRVVVAGAGGGSGGDGTAANGGEAGGPNAAGGTGSGVAGGPGGGAGTLAGGGTSQAGAGTLGQGGTGQSVAINAWSAGGGGGGGYFGGGGGGLSGNANSQGGGGGAGSSFAAPGATSSTTIATDATGIPSVTLTWTGPGGAPAPPGAGSTGGTQTGGTTVQTANGRVVLNTFIDRRPRTVVRTRNRRTTVSFAFSSNVDGVRFRCKLDHRLDRPVQQRQALHGGARHPPLPRLGRHQRQGRQHPRQLLLPGRAQTLSGRRIACGACPSPTSHGTSSRSSAARVRQAPTGSWRKPASAPRSSPSATPAAWPSWTVPVSPRPSPSCRPSPTSPAARATSPPCASPSTPRTPPTARCCSACRRRARAWRRS